MMATGASPLSSADVSPGLESSRKPVIELINLHKIYRVGTELVHALRGVTLTIRENEYVAIMGASGSGKSTLLNILGCLDVPTKGVYQLGEQDVSKLSQSKLANIRGRRIGFVFQSFELLGRTTALKNVELPLVYTRSRHRRQRAVEALRRVNLLDRAHHRPNQISGGQKQRVAIARALAQQPDIILADEPTGNLDSRTGDEIMDILDSLHAEGQTIIVVTHEDDIAQRCKRIIRLKDGLVVSDSNPTAQSTESSTREPKERGGVMRWIRGLGNFLCSIPNRFASAAGNVLTALIQIWSNKIRSLLTVLGIIIAVTSIITVVSMVEGFGNYVTSFLRGLGTNMMVVYPERMRGPHGEFLRQAEMTIDDIHAVDSGAQAIRRTSPVLFSRPTIEYGRQQITNVEMRGTNEFFQAIRNFYVDVGRFFGAVDVDSAASVCVLGREVLRKLECDESVVGDFVHIDGERFRVIGLFESKGSFMGENQDETIAIPWTTALRMYPYMRKYMMFYVEATSEDQIPDAEGQLVRILRQRHDLKTGQANDFGIFKQDEILKNFQQTRTIATSVLAGIVSISLLVGGIGIMNVMLVSVTERTREIGLRKSVGAHRRDILMQFLTEAVVLATVGGGIGIALGYAICYVAGLHPNMVDIKVPLWSVGLALGFSAGVGIFFGIIPAFKAAIIHPIDALRHE